MPVCDVEHGFNALSALPLLTFGYRIHEGCLYPLKRTREQVFLYLGPNHIPQYGSQ